MCSSFLEGLRDPRSSRPAPPHTKALQFKDEKSHSGRTALLEEVEAPEGRWAWKEWNRELDRPHPLLGHRVKGEFELLLPLLSLPVIILWIDSESAFSRSHVMRGGFLELRRRC